jgi:hypothetical protein
MAIQNNRYKLIVNIADSLYIVTRAQYKDMLREASRCRLGNDDEDELAFHEYTEVAMKQWTYLGTIDFEFNF